MSRSGRVELLLAQYEASNRGEYERILEILDDAVVWHVGGEGELRGIDAVRDYLVRLPSLFADLQYAIDDVREAGDTVLVLVRSSARGRSSGVAIHDAPTAHVWRFEGDRAVYFRVYPERADGVAAFEAA